MLSEAAVRGCVSAASPYYLGLGKADWLSSSVSKQPAPDASVATPPPASSAQSCRRTTDKVGSEQKSNTQTFHLRSDN